MVSGAFVLGNVSVDDTVRGSKLLEGIQSAIGGLLSPEAVDTGGKESREVGIRDASWCCVPINDGGVIDLISKRRRAVGLFLAIDRERRKGCNVMQHA